MRELALPAIIVIAVCGIGGIGYLVHKGNKDKAEQEMNRKIAAERMKLVGEIEETERKREEAEARRNEEERADRKKAADEKRLTDHESNKAKAEAEAQLRAQMTEKKKADEAARQKAREAEREAKEAEIKKRREAMQAEMDEKRRKQEELLAKNRQEFINQMQKQRGDALSVVRACEEKLAPIDKQNRALKVSIQGAEKSLQQAEVAVKTAVDNKKRKEAEVLELKRKGGDAAVTASAGVAYDYDTPIKKAEHKAQTLAAELTKMRADQATNMAEITRLNEIIAMKKAEAQGAETELVKLNAPLGAIPTGGVVPAATAARALTGVAASSSIVKEAQVELPLYVLKDGKKIKAAKELKSDDMVVIKDENGKMHSVKLEDVHEVIRPKE